MTATMWRQLCKQYSINIKFSLVYHPEMGDQTKSTNRVMKNYLYAYIAYTQDDWVDHLPMAKFAVSNYVNASTGMTLFFADHGFHPRTGIEPPGTYKEEQKVKLLAANTIICRQKEMIAFLQDQLA